jgi:hypothetical protein
MYQKTKRGYLLVAYRNTVPGTAKIESNETEIRLKVGDVSVLVLPWAGLGSTGTGVPMTGSR